MAIEAKEELSDEHKAFARICLCFVSSQLTIWEILKINSTVLPSVWECEGRQLKFCRILVDITHQNCISFMNLSRSKLKSIQSADLKLKKNASLTISNCISLKWFNWLSIKSKEIQRIQF